MSLKSTLFVCSILLSQFFFAQSNYTVKPSNSQLVWVGEKVTGSHEGTIQVKEGSVTMVDGKMSKGKLIIDMTTIQVTDINSQSGREKLKGHLNSPDFFAVNKFPTSTLGIDKVEHKEGDNYTLYGMLTIKNYTEKVSIDAVVKKEDNRVAIVGETKIDRTKFDIKYGSGSFFDNLGDKAIDNLFTIRFKVGAVNQ